ncbi:hypothetical protein MBAV_003061 [Candidatus Magnetobacterium bavaricum]|uniref:Uncharacterized protein n=1 Tax=Candidatus Magnetobacterium bavaricum TaxID=29290 RepID=A0A0F3GS06_9BACT|nr:hypothetical protein MBAV_003061 [Candidatus Magnetobacterium bavaricum]
MIVILNPPPFMGRVRGVAALDIPKDAPEVLHKGFSCLMSLNPNGQVFTFGHRLDMLSFLQKMT